MTLSQPGCRSPEVLDLCSEASQSSEFEIVSSQEHRRVTREDILADTPATDDADVKITGGYGLFANLNLAHQRADCGLCLFQQHPCQSNGQSCPQCYCYVCDVKASDCKAWGTGALEGDHANAHARVQRWRRLREDARNPGVVVADVTYGDGRRPSDGTTGDPGQVQAPEAGMPAMQESAVTPSTAPATPAASAGLSSAHAEVPYHQPAVPSAQLLEASHHAAPGTQSQQPQPQPMVPVAASCQAYQRSTVAAAQNWQAHQQSMRAMAQRWQTYPQPMMAAAQHWQAYKQPMMTAAPQWQAYQQPMMAAAQQWQAYPQPMMAAAQHWQAYQRPMMAATEYGQPHMQPMAAATGYGQPYAQSMTPAADSWQAYQQPMTAVAESWQTYQQPTVAATGYAQNTTPAADSWQLYWQHQQSATPDVQGK